MEISDGRLVFPAALVWTLWPAIIVTLALCSPALDAAASTSSHTNPLCPANAAPRSLRVPLNNTGIADFSLVNPRNPHWLVEPGPARDSLQRAQYRACLEDVSIQFVNRTATRSFLVSLPFTLETEARLSKGLEAELDRTLFIVGSLAATSGGPKAVDPRWSDVARTIQDELDGLTEGTACPSGVLDRVARKARGRRVLRCSVANIRGALVPMLQELAEKTRSRSAVVRQAQLLQRLTASTAKALDRYGFLPDPDKQCAEANAAGQRSCSFQVSVPANSDPTLDPRLWEAVYSSAPRLIKFVVSFFDGQDTPANATGYLRAQPAFVEETSKTSWSLTGSLAYTRDPRTGRKDEAGSPRRFSPEDRYMGGEKRRFPASGRITLAQTLGSRATGNLDLTFKSGDLGGEASTGELKASKYDFTLFGVRGSSWRAGKYAMATPSDGLAINETGEGVELVFPGLGGLSIGHIVKRESLTGKADAADRDSDVTIFQARNLPVPEKIGVTGASFTALYGEENKENQDRYTYATAGGEIQFGSSQGLDLTAPARIEAMTEEDARWRINSFSGSLAHYRSDRNARTGLDSIVPEPGDTCSTTTLCRVEDGEGHVTLLTANWSRVLVGRRLRNGAPYFRTKPLRFFRVRVGEGSADDPDTAGDEGYLGETAKFAPDKIFLSSFAADLAPPEGASIGAGLSNKSYFELAYTEQTWSPLQRLAWWITRTDDNQIRRIREARRKDPFVNKIDPIVSQASILKLHLYQFEEAVLGSRDAGLEVGLDFQIEVPKGIKSTLGLGWFFPGSALEPYLADDPFVVSYSTSLTLK
jgi:rRNA maturation protein Nop10